MDDRTTNRQGTTGATFLSLLMKSRTSVGDNTSAKNEYYNGYVNGAYHCAAAIRNRP